MKRDITGIVLAGGKNTRMGGINKAFLELQGRRIMDTVVDFLKEIFPEVIIVTNSPLEYLDFDATIVTDIHKDKGSLGGIYTGLFYASHEYVFVAPCDLPFLNRPFIEYMLESLGNHQISVPEPADGLQPLHAIYSRKTLKPMARLLEKDRLKIKDLFQEIKPQVIPVEVIRTFDAEGKMFFNINSPADIERWQKGQVSP